MDTITISPQRMIGSLEVDCSISEAHTDTLTITEHPVEQGASISDHAYVNPPMLTMRAAWSNSSTQAGGDEGYASDTYNALLALQASRQPLTVVTGKRTYYSMLIQCIVTETDERSEAILAVVVTFKGVILVQTQTVTLPPAANQARPQATAAPVPMGNVQPIPSSVTPAYATGH